MRDKIVMKEINGSHFYEKNKHIYPSVTTILQAYPKGKYFETWLKQNGMFSDELRDTAAIKGINVHKAIERLVKNETLYIKEYKEEEWKMVCRFVDFVKEQKNFRPIKSEVIVCNEHDEYAGTVDLICEIDGEIWLIDFKTSKMNHESYHLQAAAYFKAMYSEPITKAGVLILGLNTQKGWKLIETENIEERYKLFLNTYELWKYQNPKDKWTEKKVYPMELTLMGEKNGS